MFVLVLGTVLIGISSLFEKSATIRVSSRVVLWMQLVLCAAITPLVCIGGASHLTATLVRWPVVLAATCATLAFVIGLTTYLAALIETDAGPVVGIAAGYPVVTQIVAVSALGLRLQVWLPVSAILIGLGIAAINGSGNRFSKRALLLAIATMIAWGIAAVFDAQLVALVNNDGCAALVMELLARCALLPFVAAAYHTLGYFKTAEYGDRRAWLYSALCIAIFFAGFLGYLLGVTKVGVVLATIVTSCDVLVTYGGSVIFFQEELTARRLLGICVVVTGAAIASSAALR